MPRKEFQISQSGLAVLKVEDDEKTIDEFYITGKTEQEVVDKLEWCLKLAEVMYRGYSIYYATRGAPVQRPENHWFQCVAMAACNHRVNIILAKDARFVAEVGSL